MSNLGAQTNGNTQNGAVYGVPSAAMGRPEYASFQGMTPEQRMSYEQAATRAQYQMSQGAMQMMNMAAMNGGMQPGFEASAQMPQYPGDILPGAVQTGGAGAGEMQAGGVWAGDMRPNTEAAGFARPEQMMGQQAEQMLGQQMEQAPGQQVEQKGYVSEAVLEQKKRAAEKQSQESKDLARVPIVQELQGVPVAHDSKQVPQKYMDVFSNGVTEYCKNPYDLCNFRDAASWIYLRKAFGRNKGAGLNSEKDYGDNAPKPGQMQA